MLPFELWGERGPLLLMLHWLGGGSQTWTEVGPGLASRGVRFAALDAPGFGKAAHLPAKDVTSAVDAIIDSIRTLRAENPEIPWVLGGHSMGGKLATVVARRALDGEPGLDGLQGLILISPSPASPEPIEDERREQHLKNFSETTPNPKDQREIAEKWVDRNTGLLPLPAEVRERAIRGVLNNNPRAYRAWFFTGSKEDWSERVATLPLPVLLLVGSEETSLGEDKQRKFTLPHMPHAKLVVLPKAKHLPPLERPGEVVELATQFLAGLGLQLEVTDTSPRESANELLRSERTSPQTREVMTLRLKRSQNWNHEPRAFRAEEFRSLRALAQAVVPDAGFDLAACIDEQLAAGKGDGWRYAQLPSDGDAWHRGLLSLDLLSNLRHSVPFVSLYPDQQETLLQEVAAGKAARGLLAALHLGKGASAFSADEFERWFGDVRAEFTRFYIADPRTMDRIGYTGFADDFGFTQIQLGQQEEFER